MKKVLKKHKISIIMSIIVPIVIIIANSIYMAITPKDGFGLYTLGYLTPYLLIPPCLTIIWIVNFIIKYRKEHDSKYIGYAFLTPVVIYILVVIFLDLEILFFDIKDKIEYKPLPIPENLSSDELEEININKDLFQALDYNNKIYYIDYVNSNYTKEKRVLAVDKDGKNNKLICKNIGDAENIWLIKNKEIYYLEETEDYNVAIKKVNINDCKITPIVKDYEYVIDSDEENYIYILELNEKNELLKYDYVNNKIVKTKKVKLDYEGNNRSIKYSIEYLFDNGEHKYIINYNKNIDKYDLYEDGKFLISM